jgi:hypothetical protein
VGRGGSPSNLYQSSSPGRTFSLGSCLVHAI